MRMVHRASALTLTAMIVVLMALSPGLSGQRPRDTLIFAGDGTVVNLDPTVRESYADYNVFVNTNDPLFRRNRDMTPVPHLATSLRRLDDVTWEVKLRRGVRFHNGEPFDANAVKFSLDRVLNPDLRSDQIVWLRQIKEVKVIDTYTVHVIHRSVFPLVDFELTKIYPVPPGHVKRIGDQNFQRNPMGTGPYRFVSWARDADIVLERNEGYWGRKPAFKRVIIRYIPDPSTRVAALLSGDIDIAYRVPLEQVTAVERAACCAISKTLGGRVAQLQLSVMNGGHQALKDKRVRQAIAHAIDVERGVLPLEGGFAERVATTIHPKAFGHDPSIKPWPFDPARARALLAEAGYPNGFPMVINVAPELKALAEAAAGQLTRVGIRAEARVHEPTAFIQGWANHTLGGDAFMLGLISQNWDADGMFFLRFHPTGTYRYFWNDQTTRWLDEGRNTLDPARRRAVYQEMQRYLFQHPDGEMPIVPFFARFVVMGVSKRVDYQVRADEYTFFDEARPRP